jgi:putative chitinase
MFGLKGNQQMNLTPKLLRDATGASLTGIDMLCAALDAGMQKYQITTSRRIVHFLAQTAFESSLYTKFTENLNYTHTDRILAIFPTHFGPGKANPIDFVSQPNKLANWVYANRMGNGSFETGDGWKHRGAGFIELTGKDLQSQFAASVALDIDSIGHYLATTEGAAMSAAWFWDKKGCNEPADIDFIAAVTQKVNGGQNGITDRILFTKRAKLAFGI